MQKYKNVEEFLAAQSSSDLEQIKLIRALILEAEPTLIENLKWNAPNYVHESEDRITFNLINKQNKVKLIIHMGAAKKEDKNAKPVLVEDEGIVEWSSDIRGVISFEDVSDIKTKGHSLQKVIAGWLSTI